MKKALVAIMMVAVITAGLISSCTVNIKEGTMMTRDYELKDFTKIEVGGAFEVEISQADTYKVSVTAEDFPHLRIEANGDTLVIKRQGIEWFTPFHSRPKATVTLPKLIDLEVSGASKGTVKGFNSDNDLEVTLSGASTIDARNITAAEVDVKVTGASTLNGEINAKKDARFEASGASKIDLTGTGNNAVVKINGASRAEMSSFPIQNADLEISGASNAYININGRLDANVSGASTLVWAGSPVMGDIQTSGASTLRRK